MSRSYNAHRCVCSTQSVQAPTVGSHSIRNVLHNLELKNYGSNKINVSYKCPGGDAQKVSCYGSYTMKECLVPQCAECNTQTTCEVYVGNKKVSSGKVALSQGVYQIDTKTPKRKWSMERIERLATSNRAKGAASAIGATANILDLFKILSIREESLKTEQMILGSDADGAIPFLVKLTSQPLSQKEKRAANRDFADGLINSPEPLLVEVTTQPLSQVEEWVTCRDFADGTSNSTKPLLESEHEPMMIVKL